ncbi:GntR family transcriptional regulator [Cellulomonas hominis]
MSVQGIDDGGRAVLTRGPVLPPEQAPMHKYLGVRDYLRALVADGLPVGAAIPSERALCERFGVSRMTVRQAVDALVTEGVLERAQGRGTFVAAPRFDFEMRLTTFGEEMTSRGMVPSTTVLTADVLAAPADIAAHLGVDRHAPVSHLYRVRLADGTPMAIEELWVPVALAPGLLDDGVPASIYEALRERGYPPEWGEDTISASEATAHEASLLAMGPSLAVLRAERRTYSGDVACMVSRVCYRGDRYSLWVPLRAPRPAIVPRGAAPAGRSAHPGGARG